MPEPTLLNRRFVFLLIAQAGFGFAHSSFLTLPKSLAARLEAGPEEIGRVVAVSAISIVCFLIPAGSMVDRHGRKRYLIAGASLMALTSSFHVFVYEVGPLLCALRIVQALAFAYAYAAGAALCVDAAPPRRPGQAIGLLGIAFGCAFNFYQPYALSLGITELRDFFFQLSSGAIVLAALLILFEPLPAQEGHESSLARRSRFVPRRLS